MFSMSQQNDTSTTQTTLFGGGYRERSARRGAPSPGERRTDEHMVSAVLQPMQHRCAGRVWVANIDRRGEGECAFCTIRSERIGPAASAYPAAALLGRVRRDLRRFNGQKGWIWLSPWADPFVPAARDLAGPALKVAEELLRSGQELTLRTRGGLQTAGGLVTLARRHPGRVRVEIGFFSTDPELAMTWERGVATVEERLALAQALRRAGAEVIATIGPLIPLVNDSAQALASLGRRLRHADILRWNPQWVRYSAGLVPQVRREVSRSSARILQGWFHMGRGAGQAVPEVPERVRQTILGRLHEVADRQGATLTVCRCTSSVGQGQCLGGPQESRAREQLELFG
jgi:DNA repair photolyase